MKIIEKLKEMNRRNLILLLLAVVLLVATPIVLAILNEPQEVVVVSIGNQEITESEWDIMWELRADAEDIELRMGMFMYAEMMSMLLFQWAEEQGIAPTDAETRTFIDEYARAAVSNQQFEVMGISEDEYWNGMGFRSAQNLLVADRIMEYLNENDPTTTHSMEQYQNFMELGNELLQEWKLENPDLAIEFNLHEAAEILG
ncbi:MAG: hypothetical protein FWE28_01755 [Oscillospiraceae bacterium]|nr:hypothetical protein [Oscillospiraceae bacterium]